mmetsp:Transcript_3500/g.13841  ORF Transcript_3500/g.13841 Transcript_3500/m.13841 type:complete len:262 (-) Transcript_3500:351-1136(-)
MSIFVTHTTRGMLSAQAMEMCSRVILWTPMLAPTTTMQKSGHIPVNPKTVVLRYFSCPQRSMSVTDRSASFTTCAQRCECCLAVATTCSPSRYPITSTVTADVRPLSCSCRCLRTRERALPRPSSRPAEVSTPMSVLLPLSTLPIIATLTSLSSTPSSVKLGCSPPTSPSAPSTLPSKPSFSSCPASATRRIFLAGLEASSVVCGLFSGLSASSAGLSCALSMLGGSLGCSGAAGGSATTSLSGSSGFSRLRSSLKRPERA